MRGRRPRVACCGRGHPNLVMAARCRSAPPPCQRAPPALPAALSVEQARSARARRAARGTFWMTWTAGRRAWAPARAPPASAGGCGGLAQAPAARSRAGPTAPHRGLCMPAVAPTVQPPHVLPPLIPGCPRVRRRVPQDPAAAAHGAGAPNLPGHSPHLHSATRPVAPAAQEAGRRGGRHLLAPLQLALRRQRAAPAQRCRALPRAEAAAASRSPLRRRRCLPRGAAARLSLLACMRGCRPSAELL